MPAPWHNRIIYDLVIDKQECFNCQARKGINMKRHIINTVAQNMTARHIQILLALVTLSLFVIGAGAPACVGTFGG